MKIVLKTLALAASFAVGLMTVALLVGLTGEGRPPEFASLFQEAIWLKQSSDIRELPREISLLRNENAGLPQPAEIDPNVEPLLYFSERSRYRQLAKSVGRIDLLLERHAQRNVVNPCTGTIVEDGLVLTAYHCTRTDDPLSSGKDEEASQTDAGAGILDARLILNYLSADASDVVPTCLKLKPQPVEYSEELDYALFEIDPNSDSADCAGGEVPPPLPLSSKDPTLKDDLFIIHHPLGRPEHLTRKDCRITSLPAGGLSSGGAYFKHACGTLPGTSGAPIFDYETQEIIGIHVQGDRTAVATRASENEGFGVPIQQIARCNSARDDRLTRMVCKS